MISKKRKENEKKCIYCEIVGFGRGRGVMKGTNRGHRRVAAQRNDARPHLEKKPEVCLDKLKVVPTAELVGKNTKNPLF